MMTSPSIATEVNGAIRSINISCTVRPQIATVHSRHKADVAQGPPPA